MSMDSHILLQGIVVHALKTFWVLSLSFSLLPVVAFAQTAPDAKLANDLVAKWPVSVAGEARPRVLIISEAAKIVHLPR